MELTMNQVNHRIFLIDHTQKVVLEGASSDEVSVVSGVPAGSVLGSCLFLFCINDMAFGLSSTVHLRHKKEN